MDGYVTPSPLVVEHSVVVMPTGSQSIRPLEKYKNLGLPLSTITFTVNSHADNHFYKYIYLFQMLYSIKCFFIKIQVKVLYIQI